MIVRRPRQTASPAICWGLVAVTGCETPAPSPTTESAFGGPSALHRLTEPQLNHALRDLFADDALPWVALPPDVPVDGFDNHALTRDATPYLVESVQRDLLGLTAGVVAEGGPWLRCEPGGGADPVGCGHDTLAQTQQRAWRRPSTPAEQAWIHDQFDAWLPQVGFDPALQLSLLVLLQSPDFLYVVERGDPTLQVAGVRALTDWEVASRMSFLLWDTMPDAELFEAAAAGLLMREDGVRAQAQRMLDDERARSTSVRFYSQWLGAHRLQDIDPDASFFPDASDDDAVGGRVADLKAAYQAEFELFVRHAAWEQGTLDALLTSRQGFVSPLTATLYGVEFDESVTPSTKMVYPSGQAGEFFEVDMVPATLPAEERAGVFTQGAFLASTSHALRPSPVLRGVALRQRLLCVDPVPPAAGVPALDPSDEAQGTTNRDRYAAHTADPTCAGCHEPIDGVGFAFEHYDAVGVWRPTEGGQPVDATGALLGTDVDGPVADAVELVEVLAASRQAYDCAVTQLYRYGMHRTEAPGDTAPLALLQDRFWRSGGALPALLVDFVASDAFRAIRTDPGGGAP